MSYHFLMDIALILISTKLCGLLTRKFNMPQVVGALLAGVILGPALLNILSETEFLHQLSSLGVIILMFSCGLECETEQLKKTGKVSVIVALLGVVVPLIGGFAIAHVFGDGAGNVNDVLQNVFIGVILCATSVSITVECLKEMGKLSTKTGNTVLGAAVIDDILGIIVLTVITSLADSSVNVSIVLFKIVAFFVFAAVIGYAFAWCFNKITQIYEGDRRRLVIFAFVFCLMLAYIAEEVFGVADITGAFIAGLYLAKSKKKHYVATKFETLSYMLLSPIFFASIGLSVELPELTTSVVMLTLVITVIAILTKVVGCYMGAKVCKYSSKEALQVGVGMVSRGEVALVVCSKGQAVGLLPQYYFAPIVIMVLLTTILTPVLLKIVFADKQKESTVAAC